MKVYRVEDGLPSDVVKAVEQDSAGYFWIATDDGVVQFDGLRFKAFKNVLHSQYAKGFLKTRSGKLLLYGDLDLIEIQNKLDTVIFHSIRQGARNPTDSMLWYPKSIYEDANGVTWVGEPQSIVRLEGKNMKRFNFDITDRSPQFLRSFSFFESEDGTLFTCSYFGRVYKWNGTAFEKQGLTFPTDVLAIQKHGLDLFIAASDGVHRSKQNNNVFSAPELIFKTAGAEAIRFLNEEEFLVGTIYQNQFIVNARTLGVKKLGYELNDVNSIFISNENDLWLSTSRGLVLLQQNIFSSIQVPETFVECITEDKNSNIIYYATNTDLYKVVEGKERKTAQSILNTPRGYFQSLLVTDLGLWASNGFQLLLLKDEKTIKQWDFEKEGRFVHDLSIDKDKNVWLSQSGSVYVKCFAPDFSLKRFRLSLERESILNIVRVNEDGIYAVASGTKGYMFFKSYQDSVFRDISVPVNLKLKSDFNINDMVFLEGQMWLATTEGLVLFDRKTMKRVDLGEKYSQMPVKSVEIFEDNQLLFVNSFGLFLYDIKKKNLWVFDESNGLASNTITTRGILVDHSKKVWVGTSLGLSYSLSKINLEQKTLKPYFVEVQVNGVKQKFVKAVHAKYGSFINLLASSITFPESKVELQYRVDNSRQWHAVEKNTINISDLYAGHHTIEVRARKSGGYNYSDPRKLDLYIGNPFWQEPWFLFVVVVLVATIFWFSFLIAARINRQRRSYLEKLVEQRTRELQKANEELTVRNSELDRFVYSASHDLSAPLKSLLGLVNIAKMENPSQVHVGYLNMMEQSVKRMETFIRDVINYSRNARVAISYQQIDFKKLVDAVLTDHQYAPNFNKIDFQVTANVHSDLVSDEMRLRIILNNLVSNAIKFQMSSDGRQPYIAISLIELETEFLLEVSDNGRGIPPNMLPKVFEMFFRATDTVQGSGLGLYILKESVGKLEGVVEVASALGQGTTFKVRLPKIPQNSFSLQK